MSSWADDSDEHLLHGIPPHTGGAMTATMGGGAGGSRPRLNLKPRTVDDSGSGTGGGGNNNSSSKSNPFGAAKPREHVLASKGIDFTSMDTRIEKKAAVPRLTAEQDRQVETLRQELTQIEEKMREANENELPEEEFRVAAEEKRTELNKLMELFMQMNVEERAGERVGVERAGERGDRHAVPQDAGGSGGDFQRKYERPSERRRRLDQKRHDGGRGYGGFHGEHDDHSRGSGHYNDRNDRYGGYSNDRGYNDRNDRGSYGGRGGRGYNDHGGYGGGHYEGEEDPYASFSSGNRHRYNKGRGAGRYGGGGRGGGRGTNRSGRYQDASSGGYNDRYDSYRGRIDPRDRNGDTGYDRNDRGDHHYSRYGNDRNDRSYEYDNDHYDQQSPQQRSGRGYHRNNKTAYNDKYAGDRYNY